MNTLSQVPKEMQHILTTIANDAALNTGLSKEVVNSTVVVLLKYSFGLG